MKAQSGPFWFVLETSYCSFSNDITAGLYGVMTMTVSSEASVLVEVRYCCSELFDVASSG